MSKNNAKSKPNSALASKKTEPPIETRTKHLVQKIKVFEEELARVDLERTRLLQQLDRVCEEKDEKIKELKTSLYEKTVESEHQTSLFKQEKQAFEETIQTLNGEINALKQMGQSQVETFQNEKNQLEAQLNELKEYMAHKDETMARIKQLEEGINSDKLTYEKGLIAFQQKVNIERDNIREEIAKQVQEIATHLEASCYQKLALDARLALEKFGQINHRLEITKKTLETAEKENQGLRESLHNRKLRLEIAEGLLSEMLKQLQRKYNARKDCGVQVNLSRRYQL